MNRVCRVVCVALVLAALGCGGPPGKPALPAATPNGGPPPKGAPQPTDTDKRAAGDRSAAPNSSGGQNLLTPDDFTFVGSYTFSADDQATFGMGLTSRRVKGELRFLTFALEGPVKARLIEFGLPAKVGQEITQLSGSWDDIWSPAAHGDIGGSDRYGLWWEDQGDGKGRLWTTHCTDYPDDEGIMATQALAVRTLNDDGTISDLRGEYGFQGVGQRAIYGGIQPIPRWFRDKYGLSQPYAVGWGGYASRMAQGLVPSLGLIVLAIPDVTSYKNDSVIPAKDFKILADHRSGTRGDDWYASRKPTKFDRGQRNADVVNYYDGGDPRQNPSSEPSEKPAAGAQWLSPAPDGFGRFVWGDSFNGAGCWIDGPKKGGFVVIGSFAKGKAYYQTSALHCHAQHAELQVFDPNDFAKVLQGKKEPWNVQPAATKLLTDDLAPLGLLTASSGEVAGATFDPETKLLYLWCPGINEKYGCVLAVYKVNC